MVDIAYPPIVQSGGKYDLKVGKAACLWSSRQSVDLYRFVCHDLARCHLLTTLPVAMYRSMPAAVMQSSSTMSSWHRWARGTTCIAPVSRAPCWSIPATSSRQNIGAQWTSPHLLLRYLHLPCWFQLPGHIFNLPLIKDGWTTSA